MRFILMAAAIGGLAGCAGDGGDSGTKTGTTPTDDTGTPPEAFALLRDGSGMVTGTGATGDFTTTTATYTMTTTTEAGNLAIDITETGDMSGGTQWNEHHDGFVLDSSNADGSFTYKLVLTGVDDFNDVVANSTTLFFGDPGANADFFGRITWFWWAESADGSESDCMVNGHSDSYYAADCSYYEG